MNLVIIDYQLLLRIEEKIETNFSSPSGREPYPDITNKVSNRQEDLTGQQVNKPLTNNFVSG